MSEPVRVAQVLNRMDSGGVEAAVMNYCRHFSRERVQVDFYFAEGSSLPQREELERLGAGIYPVPGYGRIFRYQRALYQAFREKEYPIVHAHLSTMSVFALFAAWRAGVPVRICHSHSTAHWGEGAKTLLKYILRPWNKLFATAYFACGERAGRWMYGDRCFSQGRVTVAPNAIETKRFAFDLQARQQLREELGIPQSAWVVGHVGRFMFQKNHGFLLDIFAQALAERADAILLLVGEGELQEAARRQAQRLGIASQVRFTGARRDVCRLYSAMDVFCLPSLYEGMPVVAWEAQANGLPCVFSDEVGTEAALGAGCRFLNRGQPAGDWVQALLHAGGRAETQAPDIQEYAGWLEKKYAVLARRPV